MGARAVRAWGAKDAFVASLACSLLMQPPLHSAWGSSRLFIKPASRLAEHLPARLLPTSCAGGHEPSRAG